MAVLKWQRGANDWVQLYGSVLRNRLRRDKNLADLTDIEEAQKNLGLFGDVVTHNHDTLYKPVLERIEGKVDQEIENRKMAIKNVSSDLRARAEAAVSSAIESFGISISQEASIRKESDNKLDLKIAESRLEAANAVQQESMYRANDKKELIGRIEDERLARESAIDGEQKDRDAAIAEALQQLSQEVDDRKAAINQEVAERNDAIDRKAVELQGAISKETTTREQEIADLKSWASALISSETAERNASEKDMEAKDEDLLRLIEQRFKDAILYVNSTMLNYCVGDQPPANPVNNKTVWFDTTNDSEEIKIFKDNRWVLFGAGYL